MVAPISPASKWKRAPRRKSKQSASGATLRAMQQARGAAQIRPSDSPASRAGDENLASGDDELEPIELLSEEDAAALDAGIASMESEPLLSIDDVLSLLRSRRSH